MVHRPFSRGRRISAGIAARRHIAAVGNPHAGCREAAVHRQQPHRSDFFLRAILVGNHVGGSVDFHWDVDVAAGPRRVSWRQPDGDRSIAPGVRLAVFADSQAAVGADIDRLHLGFSVKTGVFQPLVNPLHHALPDGQGRVGFHSFHHLGFVVAKPNASGVIRRHADKPAVKIVVGGSGFARRLNTGYFGSSAGALGARHHVGQEIQHIVGRLLGHGLHCIRRVVQQHVALGVVDLGIDPGLVVISVISKGRVGRRDIHHRNAVGQAAQGQRAQSHVGNLAGIALFIGDRPAGFQRQSHILRGKLKGFLWRHSFHQVHRNGVGGNLNSLAHRHPPLPHAAVGGVFWPASGIDGKIFGHVVHHRSRGDKAIFQGRGVNAHRLYGRTWRPGGAGGSIEHQIARLGAPPAVQRLHFAGALVDNHHGALGHLSVLPQYAGEVVRIQEHCVHLGLDLRIQGADDAQAAGVDHLPGHFLAVALLAHQVFHHAVEHFVDEIRPNLLFVVLPAVLPQLKLLGFGLPGLAFADKAILLHLVQHQVPPVPIEFRETDGVVFIGVFSDARDGGAFHQRQLVQLFAKIDFGRRPHAVGALPQVDGVQVELQDIIFFVFLVQLQRPHDLRNLSLDGSLVVAGDILNQLLGDG